MINNKNSKNNKNIKNNNIIKELSFSQKVKSELASVKEHSKLSRHILLRGILYGMRRSNGVSTLTCENEAVLNLLQHLLSQHNPVTFEKSVSVITDSTPIFTDSVSDIGGDRETGLFLRGVFLACGVVSDPEKEYHLELVPQTEEKNEVLLTMINERGIAIKKSSRKGQPFLYIKESESIADFLTYTGAVNCSMEIMNIKILKEVRNNVNRTVNCEAANIDKTAKAAGKQLSDIEYIQNKKGLEFLPPELRQIAEIRLENVEMSLRDIGESIEPRLSRSGVNHRLRRISAIADELRKGD